MALTRDQEQALRSAFRPHAPIEDPDTFIGREEERARVADAITEPGLQVVVFGERGAGKTSLANVATASTGVKRIQVFCERNASFAQVCRDILLKYMRENPKQLRYNAVEDTIEVGGSSLPASQLTGNLMLQALPEKVPLCIVLDELDRLDDKSVVAELAELAKNISTYNTHITMVFVGVAGTADELLAGHSSNFRNLRQVPLDRMTEEELKGIIDRGERVLGITFNDETVGEILQLCDRFPYYLHLLATNSAKNALQRQSGSVEKEDLSAGIARAAGDADQSLREVYEHAILSVKQSKIYRRILWSMAVLPGASHTVREIADATNALAEAEGDVSVTPQSVGQALVALASAEKRHIAISKTQGFYSFSNPLMKGFVRLTRARA
jgi:uncharacterized protein